MLPENQDFAVTPTSPAHRYNLVYRVITIAIPVLVPVMFTIFADMSLYDYNNASEFLFFSTAPFALVCLPLLPLFFLHFSEKILEILMVVLMFACRAGSVYLFIDRRPLTRTQRWTRIAANLVTTMIIALAGWFFMIVAKQ